MAASLQRGIPVQRITFPNNLIMRKVLELSVKKNWGDLDYVIFVTLQSH